MSESLELKKPPENTEPGVESVHVDWKRPDWVAETLECDGGILYYSKWHKPREGGPYTENAIAARLTGAEDFTLYAGGHIYAEGEQPLVQLRIGPAPTNRFVSLYLEDAQALSNLLADLCKAATESRPYTKLSDFAGNG